MGRWLTATIVLASVLAAGMVAFLNAGEPLPIHLAPGRTIALPLGTALALAFATGALLVALLAAAGAMGRAFAAWRRAQQAERTAARLARTRTRAETLLVSGDADGARSRLADAMTTAGPDERLLELLAGAAERSGDLGGAIAVVEDARARRPDSPLVARRLRDLYVDAGRWEDALRLDEAGVGTDGLADTCAVRFEAACADEADRGLRRLQALAREHPGFVPAWVVAGDRLRERGRLFRARRTWERGARVRPAAVLLARLAALDDDGHPGRTARRLAGLRRQHPDDATVLAALVRRHLDADALDEAEAALATWPADGAASPALDALRGECARRRGRLDDATALLARAARTCVAPDLGRCRACGHCHAAWVARCSACGRWDTCGA